MLSLTKTYTHMKRYGWIYEKIYSLDNLILAHHNARKNKAFYKEVKEFNRDEVWFALKLQKLLKDWTYKINPEDYKVQKIRDRTKERELYILEYMPHRPIQWAILQQIEPILIKTFTNFTCASIPWRWNKRIQNLKEKYLKDKEWTKYCLKMDIKQYYPSINHSILKQLLRKKFKDKRLLELLDMIIDSYPKENWLPIWSYLSQYLANYYLAFFDHRLKENLWCKYVLRYMDDIVILWGNKDELWYWFKQIKFYLDNNLKLKIKSNYQVFPVDSRWVDYVWYRYFHWYSLLRKRTCKKFKRKVTHILLKQSKWQFINYRERASTNSYIGWLIHCNSYRLYSKYIAPIISSIQKYYFFIIGKKNKKKFRLYNKKLLRKKWKINYII